MNWLIAPPTSVGVVVGPVGVRVDLLPVGEELGVGQWSVDLVGVEPDAIGASRDPDDPVATGFHQAPRSCHGYQVTPRVEHVTVPEKKSGLDKFNES